MKKCSFCGKNVEDKNIVLEGHLGDICINCFEKGINKAKGIKNRVEIGDNSELLKPHEIKAKLDEFIIGQEEAKKFLSVEVYNHYKRIYRADELEVDVQKTNVLLTGPTGSGKTYIIQILSKILNVPLVIGDATTITETGYVGKDADSLIKALYIQSNGDIKKTERGIIYIDEIDKIATKSNRKSEKDPSGEGAQQTLLKLLEGSEVTIEISNGIGKTPVTINTNNILFICGGAFNGINEIIKNRLGVNKAKGIGFNVNEEVEEKSKDYRVTSEDLVKYGMIEELVGRIPLIATLNKLTEEELLDILLNSKNSIITQYKALFKLDKVDIEFEEGALKYIVKEAIKKDVGARGLRGIIADKMNNLMFDIPQKELKEFKVTKEYLQSY